MPGSAFASVNDAAFAFQSPVPVPVVNNGAYEVGEARDGMQRVRAPGHT